MVDLSNANSQVSITCTIITYLSVLCTVWVEIKMNEIFRNLRFFILSKTNQINRLLLVYILKHVDKNCIIYNIFICFAWIIFYFLNKMKISFIWIDVICLNNILNWLDTKWHKILTELYLIDHFDRLQKIIYILNFFSFSHLLYRSEPFASRNRKNLLN